MWAIPLIGPLFQMVTSIFTKIEDTKLGEAKIDGQVDQTSIKASAAVTLGFKDQPDVRFCRDLIMVPGSAWSGLFIWDKIVAHHYPWLVWDVAALTGPMAILPMALLTFFFSLAAIGGLRK